MPDVSKHLEKAEKHLQKGKLEQALDEFVNVLDLDPNEDTVRQRAADICLSLNRERQASLLLGDAFDHYLAADRVSEASTTYKKLLRLGRVTAERTFRLAQLFDKHNSRRDALEAYDQAATDFLAQGRKQTALTALRRMMALEPNTEVCRREATLAEQLGDRKGAGASFFQLGQFLRKEGKTPTEAFEKAFDLDPMNGDIAAAYALELIQHKDVAGAAKALKPFADRTGDRADLQKKYLECLLYLKRLDEAEPVALMLFDNNPEEIEVVGKIIGLWLKVGENVKAAELARELQSHAEKSKKMREFLAMLNEIAQQNQPGIAFLEYLGTVYNSNNREHEYCETLLRLFDLNFAAHNFLKAADCLDRAVDVDAYESGHQQRLEMLRGKIDPGRYDLIGTRIVSVLKTQPVEQTAAPQEQLPSTDENEPTMLEDLMLQAEIFLQYSMKPKAMDRIQRLHRLFPREEEKNDKLRHLYAKAGFSPKYDESAVVAEGASEQAGAATQKVIDNFARVTEISRNIARQGTVKSALFTTVNEVGRHWNVSRCVAGLGSPDKPPTAVIEYCAPGVKKSDTASLVKIIPFLQNLCIQAEGAVVFTDTTAVPELNPIRGPLATLEIRSLMAVPLIDVGNEHTGIVILEQSDRQRTWRKVDEVVLKTIAEQVVQAVNNAKLRSLVKNLAVTEEHSGLLKRASYLDVLLAEVRRGQVQKSPITLMLLSFGSGAAMVKDAGEPAVESMMRDIGQLVTSNLRQNDSAIRYDTASVALMLADTGEKNALLVLDKLRKLLSSIRLGTRKDELPMSAGIAEVVIHPHFEPADIVTEAINRLEAALERAKLEGPNGAFTLTAVLPDAHAGAAV